MSLNILGKAFLGACGLAVCRSLYDDVKTEAQEEETEARKEEVFRELRSYAVRGKWILFNMTLDECEDDDGNTYTISYEDRCHLWLTLRES